MLISKECILVLCTCQYSELQSCEGRPARNWLFLEHLGFDKNYLYRQFKSTMNKMN